MGRAGDGEMERAGDGEIGRAGDGESGRWANWYLKINKGLEEFAWRTAEHTGMPARLTP